MYFRYPTWAPSDGKILCSLAVCVPVMAAIAPLLIVLPGILAAVIILIRRILHRLPIVPHQCRPFAVTTLGLVLWGCTTAIWSIDGAQSLLATLRLLAVSCLLITLLTAALEITEADSKLLRNCLVAGIVLGVLLTLVRTSAITAVTIWVKQEEMAAHKLSALNRTASILAVMAWPTFFCIALKYRRYTVLGFILATALSIFILGPIAPLLALFVGACALTIAWFHLAAATVLLCSAFIACILLVPFFPQLSPWASQLLTSTITDNTAEIHRFVIWQFASEHVLQRPLFGWGLDAARAFPGSNEELFINKTAEGIPVTAAAMPLHTHNATLQIWLELGLVGIILWCSFFLQSIRYILVKTQLYSATVVATVTSALVVAHLSFGIWQGWWLATLGITAVFTVAVRKYNPEEPHKKMVN